jgi:hypothetical protein
MIKMKNKEYVFKNYSFKFLTFYMGLFKKVKTSVVELAHVP